MNWKRKVTVAMLVIVAAVIIIWDIFVAIDGRDIAERADTTVSGITLGWAQQHPALPFSLGGLFGHLLWPMREATRRILRVTALAALALGWLIVDIWVAFSVHAMLVFVPGIGLGHLLWPQVDVPKQEPPKTES
jgi:hypothetical protein